MKIILDDGTPYLVSGGSRGIILVIGYILIYSLELIILKHFTKRVLNFYTFVIRVYNCNSKHQNIRYNFTNKYKNCDKNY